MKDVSFGQYYPVESPVHRLDPRVKLLSVVLYIVGIFFIQKFHKNCTILFNTVNTVCR